MAELLCVHTCFPSLTFSYSTQEPEETPLQIKLNRVVKIIVKAGIVAAVLLFIALFKFLVQLRGSTLAGSEKGQQFVQILIISIIILRIDNKFNVFAGMHRNPLFLAITSITVGGQILIIYFGGTAFSVTRINRVQWAVSILLGLLSLPFGAIIRLIQSHGFRVLRSMLRNPWSPNAMRRSVKCSTK